MTDGKAEYKRRSSASNYGNLLSNVGIDNGDWHNVTLTVALETVVLDVDGNQATSDVTGFDPRAFSVSTMAIGGVPSNVLSDAKGLYFWNFHLGHKMNPVFQEFVCATPNHPLPADEYDYVPARTQKL